MKTDVVLEDPPLPPLSGRRLARNAIWNFAGMAAPMLVALVAIPLLIEGMGEERFGLLAIVWMGVGYFSLLDMGLGQALTKLVAERLGAGQTADLGPLIWTAVWLIAFLGLLGAIGLLFGADPLIRHVLNVWPDLQTEAITAFRVLALGLPLVVLTSALIGLLEAHQRFATIAAVRIPLGVMTFGGPLITLQFSPSLTWATAALLAARLTAGCVYYILVASIRTELRWPVRPKRHHLRPLFHFGGWLTVSNIIGPMMVYFDRFLIGAVLTMTAVTFYVTPYEVISRAQMLPQALMAVLFPALTMAMAGDRPRVAHLYRQAARILFLLMLPAMAAFFLLAPEALDLWLGAQFREVSTPVVQWLALGVLINTLARPPLTVLQSAGRPDLVAKAHLLELVPYGLALWFFTSSFGIVGTAAAWCTRVVVDAFILNELARRRVPELAPTTVRTYLVIGAVLALSAPAFFLSSFAWRGSLLLCTVALAGLGAWPILRDLTSQKQRVANLGFPVVSTSSVAAPNYGRTE